MAKHTSYYGTILSRPSPRVKKKKTRLICGTQEDLLTVASFRTWRGSKAPVAQGPVFFDDHSNETSQGIAMGELPTSTAIDLAASGLNGENHLASRPGKQGLRSAQQARLGPALRGPLCGEGRREGDLNPRGSFWPPTRFPVVLLQPGSDISPNPACVAPRRKIQKISEPRAGTSGAAFRSPLCGVWRRERDLNPRWSFPHI